jgi:hypothetical protein
MIDLDILGVDKLGMAEDAAVRSGTVWVTWHYKIQTYPPPLIYA